MALPHSNEELLSIHRMLRMPCTEHDLSHAWLGISRSGLAAATGKVYIKWPVLVLPRWKLTQKSSSVKRGRNKFDSHRILRLRCAGCAPKFWGLYDDGKVLGPKYNSIIWKLVTLTYLPIYLPTFVYPSVCRATNILCTSVRVCKVHVCVCNRAHAFTQLALSLSIDIHMYTYICIYT